MVRDSLLAPLAADRALDSAYFVVAQGQKHVPLVLCRLLAPLAAAGACGPLPSSLPRRRKACLLARSSRTAARQLASKLLAPLAAAGACGPLPSSLPRRRKACLLARSSTTAARQPAQHGGARSEGSKR